MIGLPSDSHLEGRRIVLTGASGGIGRVVAGELATQGASLALIARHREGLEELAQGLVGGPHDVFPFDVRDENAWSAVSSHLAPEGMLHGVVTAAATLSPIGPVGSWSMADFRSTIDLNVVGSLLAVVAGLDGLKMTGGSIVTFSGGGATAPFGRFDAYATSKAAVVRLTENLAQELAEAGIRANSVAPGFVISAMHQETLVAGPIATGSAYYERTVQAITDESGDSADPVAKLIAFLLSDKAAGITGKLISARWDPWTELDFQERLRAEPDLATLRRIDDQWFAATGAR